MLPGMSSYLDLCSHLQAVIGIPRGEVASIIILKYGGGTTDLFENLMKNKSPLSGENLHQYLAFIFGREAHRPCIEASRNRGVCVRQPHPATTPARVFASVTLQEASR